MRVRLLADVSTVVGGRWSTAGVTSHRCSYARCLMCAVAVIEPVAPADRPPWSRRRARRWFCTDHLAAIRREVRRGQVWWQVLPTDVNADLRTLAIRRAHRRGAAS